MRLTIMSRKVKNINNTTYENIYDDGELVDLKQIDMDAPDEEALKEKFLKAKFGTGKVFGKSKRNLHGLIYFCNFK